MCERRHFSLLINLSLTMYIHIYNIYLTHRYKFTGHEHEPTTNSRVLKCRLALSTILWSHRQINNRIYNFLLIRLRAYYYTKHSYSVTLWSVKWSGLVDDCIDVWARPRSIIYLLVSFHVSRRYRALRNHSNWVFSFLERLINWFLPAVKPQNRARDWDVVGRAFAR